MAFHIGLKLRSDRRKAFRTARIKITAIIIVPMNKTLNPKFDRGLSLISSWHFSAALSQKQIPPALYLWRKFDYSLCFTTAGLLVNVLTEKGALDNNMGYQPDASLVKNRLRCICCLSAGFILIVCEKSFPHNVLCTQMTR